MKIFHELGNYSRIFLQKKPFKHKIFSSIPNQIFKMYSNEHNDTTLEVSHFSKSLDNFKVHYKNQFACLLTKCVFCNNMCLYINKITGKYFNQKY